ncbi:MAG: LamG-like jellyroll fold domain-containing protein [Pirellulales bacterium]
MTPSLPTWFRRARGLDRRTRLTAELRRRLRKTLRPSVEQLEARALMAVVSLGEVVPLAEGFGYGSTIAGLGKAMDLGGTDQFGQARFKSNSQAIADSGTFSMETWLYPKSGQTSGVIMSLDPGYSLYRVDDTGLRFTLARIAQYERNDIGIDLTLPRVLTPDAWNHIAVTYDGERAQVYVNGVHVGASTPFNPDPTPLRLYPISSFNLNLSKLPSIPGVNAGAMDEIRVWNIARTQAEIQESMMTPLTGLEPGLVSYWNFDNRSPNATEVELDSARSGNDLFIAKPRDLLNAAPQVGYVEVKVDAPVAQSQGLWVAYDVVGGTALEGVDFSGASFRKASNVPSTERNGIIIPKGATRGRIYFVARPDAIAEATETFAVRLAPYSFSGATPSDYAIGAVSQTNVSILDSGAYRQAVGLLDSQGRAVAAVAPLFVDPVTRRTTFSVRLTSEPDFPSPTDDLVFLNLEANSASVDDGRGAAQSLTLRFTPADWSQPRTFTLTGVTSDGRITLSDVTPTLKYLSGPVSFPYTLTPPSEARPRENNPFDAAPVVPSVNLLKGANALEGDDIPGRFIVQLDAPAPSGGLDVFYSVVSTARESIDFERLPGVIHVPAGLREVQVPVFPIDNQVASAARDIRIQLNTTATTYRAGTTPNVSVTLLDDDKPRIVAVNPSTVDIVQEKSLQRVPVVGEETQQPFALNDDTKPSLGVVGSFEASTWTYAGGLGASFTAGQFDADRLEFTLAATADAEAKIRVRFSSTDENGQPTVRLVKSGADAVNSVSLTGVFDAASGAGTRLVGGSLANPRLPTAIADDTLEWSLAGLPPGTYRLILATTSNLAGQLANPGGVTGASFRYEAKFTSNPVAPYQVFTTSTVSSFSDNYSTLVTSEPVPTTPPATEPNNSVAAAYSLGTAYNEQLLTGQMIDAGGDEDLYRFTLNQADGRPDTLVAEFLRGSNSVNPLLMDILNTDGSVRIAAAPRAQNQYQSLVGLPDGEYLVRVRAANSSIAKTDYTLRFRTLINASERDANNAVGQATYLGTVVSGDRINDMAIVGSTDQDYYRFTLDSKTGRPDSVSVIAKNSAGALFVQLVNATTGSALAQAPGNPDVKTMSLASLPDGDYALRVEGDNVGLQNKYDVAFGAIVPRQAEVSGNRIAFRLNSQPTANVTVALTSQNTAQGTISPSTLTFTPTNWDDYQMIVVAPQDDGLFNGDVNYTILAKASSADPNYQSLVLSLPVTNVDRGNFVQPAEEPIRGDEGTPTVSITTLTTSLNEGQTALSFRVSLDKPFGVDSTVLVDFTRGTAVEGTNFTVTGSPGDGTPLKLKFFANETKRDIAISTIRDLVQRSVGGEPLVIRATVLDADGYRPAQKADPGYSAALNLQELDQAGFLVNGPTGIESTTLPRVYFEPDRLMTPYRIALKSKPKADVIVPIAVSDSSETLLSIDQTSPGAAQIFLRFTPDNWNNAQTFYMRSVDDVVADGAVFTRFTASAEGDDEVYRALKPQSFQLMTLDDDQVGVTVASPQATVSGRANVFSVRLNTQPIGEVRVTMTPRNDQIAINGERAGEPSTIVFNALNWNIPQLTQVVANDDKIVENFHTSQIDFQINSGRVVADAPSIDNSTAATAVPLGDVAGGLNVSGMRLPYVAQFPNLGEEWYRFRITQSQSTSSQLRVTTFGSNQIFLPKLELYNAATMQRLAQTSPTSAVRTADGLVQTPAVLKQSLQNLAAGEYLVRLYVDGGVPTDMSFSLWFDDGDRAYDAVKPASIPVSIKDDDLPIAELLAGPMASEVSSEPSYFAVRLNAPAPAGPADVGVQVFFKVTGGSASQGIKTSTLHDYTVIADNFDPATGVGWVRVAPGDVQANIGILPVDDKLVEDVPLEVQSYNATTKTLRITGKASTLSPADSTAASYSLFKDTTIVVRAGGDRELTLKVSATTPLNRVGSGDSAVFQADVPVDMSTKDAFDATTLLQTVRKARVKSETVAITLQQGADYVLPLAPDKQNLSPAVAANLDLNRISTNLTIFDDDVPGIEIIEIGEHTTVAEGDEAAFQIALTSEPLQAVEITLTPGLGLAFASPQNSTNVAITPTAYRMAATGLPDNLDLVLVSVDETDAGFTATFDARLTRPKLTASAQSLPLTVTNTGVPSGVAASSARTTFELPSVNAVDLAGNPEEGLWQGVRRFTLSNLSQQADGQFTFTASLGTAPAATLTLTPFAAPSVTVATTKLTFQPADWFKPQTVVVKALHDSFAQPGEWRKSTIQYAVSSVDLNWHDMPVAKQEIHVRDLQMNVGDTVEGLSGAFGALTMGLQGLEVPIVGSVGDLPVVSTLFAKVESPLVKSLGAQESLTVEQFDELAESALEPLVANDTVDAVVVTPSSDSDEVRVALHVEKSLNLGTIDLDSDLGLEALGITFATQGVASLDVDFSFDLVIGWHRQFGFFIDTAQTGVHMGLKLSLQGPANDPSSAFTGVGSLGILQVDFTNDPDNPTELSITFDAALNDLDNLNTTQFFDLNGDGVLADSPILYQVGVDSAPRDGRIDLSAAGAPIYVSTSQAAVEPFNTIDARGQSSTFPSVNTISRAGGNVGGAAAANWNTVGAKATTFDEAELTLQEGQYLKETRGAVTIVYLDANRNGKLDVAVRNLDPFTRDWTSLTAAQKNSSEVWTTSTATGVIPEFRILTTGAGANQKSFIDVNRNNRADAAEEISASLLKKLDKDKSKVLEGDVRQDGEGVYQQGTSTAYFDSNRNRKQDFLEPFISYSFGDFTLDSTLAVEDDQNVLFLDLDGDGALDSGEPRVIVVDLGDAVVLDLNGNGQADLDEPKSARAAAEFAIPQSKVDANSQITFNTYQRPVLTLDGVRFIDLDRNGELTVNADGEPLEPWAGQLSELSTADMNRLVQRIHAFSPTLFAGSRTAIEDLAAGRTITDVAQAAIKTTFDKLVAEGKVVLQPSDGDRLTLAELAAFRTTLQASATTRTERVKSAASELFTFEFQGSANIGFNTRTSLEGSTMMPSLEFDLAVSIPLFNFGNAEQADDQGFTVDFNNVTIDLGTFLQKYVEPILATANDVIGPIKPIVTALNADTKLLGKLGLASAFESDGRPGISILEIARKIRSGNSAEVAKIDKAIKFSKQIATLVDTIDALSQQLSGDGTKLEFGNFSLSDLRASSESPSSSAAQVRQAKRNDGTPAATTTVPRTTAADVEAQAKKSSSLKNRFDALQKVEGLKINLFDPNTVLSLLMGESNVDLVTYDVPDFAFDFRVERNFRIWGPIAGKLEGGFNVTTDLSVGYDTNGLQAWSDSGFDPLQSYLVLDGIYVNDWNAAGAEKDELTVSAFVSAGVGIDIGIASGFVKGGVEGIIGFDIIDVGERAGTSDGKIRGSDILHKMANNPADLFDLSGKINAFLAAEVKVNLLFFKKTVYNNRLATFELAKFKLSPGASGSSLAGKVQTGPISGGTVWFDADNNLFLDEGEPFTLTDLEGNYELIVPDEFDLSTGTVRVAGGRDTSTGLASHDEIAIPPGGRGNATALTALEESLVVHAGLSLEESQALVEETFGIDAGVDLSHFAHHDEALAGNELARPVLLAENNVNSLVQQMAAALAAATGVPLDDRRYSGVLSTSVFAALAEHLRTHDLDLVNPVQLKLILQDAARRANEQFTALELHVQVDVARLAAYEDAIATVGAATVENQRVLAASASDVIEAAHRVTQEKLLANGEATTDLYVMVTGMLAPEVVVAKHGQTGPEALGAILAVKLPPLASAIPDITTFEDAAIDPIQLTVRRQMSAPGEVVVEASSDNPDLLPEGSITIEPISRDGYVEQFEIYITPTSYRHGTANVTLLVADTAGNTVSETFAVDVLWTNHAPVAVDDVVSAVAGRAAIVHVLDNDVDYDGDLLHVGLVSAPEDGTAVVNADGTITYTPAVDAVGSRTLVYEVDDRQGGYSTASLTFELIDSAADLAIMQVASPVSMTGHEVVFAMQVVNLGPHSAEDVVVADLLPAGVLFISAQASPGFTIEAPELGAEGGPVVFRTSSLARGQTANLLVVGRVAESAETGSLLVNTVAATTSSYDVDETNNQASGESLVNGSGVHLAPSAMHLGLTDLVITGTAANNNIQVSPAANGRLQVTMDGKLTGNLSATGDILVYGGAGADVVRIASTVKHSAFLFGDAGNDSLTGGGGPTVLSGGAGADTLTAGSVRSLLFGGLDADRLTGATGDNLLVAGTTVYDDDAVSLAALLAEWASANRYEDRVDHILEGGGLNGATTLNEHTAFDDEAIDSLFGGAGRNWYFTRETGGGRLDQVARRKSTERTTRI